MKLPFGSTCVAAVGLLLAPPADQRRRRHVHHRRPDLPRTLVRQRLDPVGLREVDQDVADAVNAQRSEQVAADLRQVATAHIDVLLDQVERLRNLALNRHRLRERLRDQLLDRVCEPVEQERTVQSIVVRDRRLAGLLGQPNVPRRPHRVRAREQVFEQRPVGGHVVVLDGSDVNLVFGLRRMAVAHIPESEVFLYACVCTHSGILA